MKNLASIFGGVIIAAVFFSSCLKQSYSNPPDLSNYDPNLPVQVNIHDLVKPFWATNTHRVMGDTTITGVVVADDRTGNFYKQIIINDSSAGINIALSSSYLYSNYPIGRKVYVKLKGLTIMNYKNEVEVCASYDPITQKPVAIPSTLMDSCVIAASFPHTVVPREIRYIDILSYPDSLSFLLVKLDNMEVDSNYLHLPYAAPSTIAISTPRMIDQCINGVVLASGSLQLYNSGFANFYSDSLPSGTGSITGIFSRYGSGNQFQIRDTTDVQFYNARCK